MDEYPYKAIIYDGPEDTYGPCGCGMDMAILPVLLPKVWFEDEFPDLAMEHEFCKGLDCRRVSGLSCNNVLEHDMEGIDYLANFSCCRACADKAVDFSYAVMSDESYPFASYMGFRKRV